MDLKAGHEQEKNERGLRPVPETLEALENINACHDRLPVTYCAWIR